MTTNKRLSQRNKKFLLTLPEEVHIVLKIHATTKSESLNSLINEILLRFLTKNRINEIKNAYSEYGLKNEDE